MSQEPDAPMPGAELVLQSPEGDPWITVGRDRSTPESARDVRCDVLDISVVLGPRTALRWAEALTRYATAILSEGRPPAPKAVSSRALH